MLQCKALKFRIYPNAKQLILFVKTFGCVRFLYNKMLEDKIRYYKETKDILRVTPASYKKEFEWLKEVDSLALANAQMNLQVAYQNFFRTPKTGFPKFKSRNKGHNSYTTNLVNGNIALEDGYLKLPKVGLVKVKQHRQRPDNCRLKSVTISRTATGKYYASILYELDEEVQPVQPTEVLGLDFSMKRQITNAYGAICIEVLNMQGMA